MRRSGCLTILAYLAALTIILVALVSCATTQPVRPAIAQRASLAIDDLVALNAVAQRGVAFLAPWLSPERQARVRAAAALVDGAIARVAAARDVAEQDDAIAAARATIAAYKRLAGS